MELVFNVMAGIFVANMITILVVVLALYTLIRLAIKHALDDHYNDYKKK